MEKPHGTIFVSIPSLLDASVAAPGTHVMHVFTPDWVENWKVHVCVVTFVVDLLLSFHESGLRRCPTRTLCILSPPTGWTTRRCGCSFTLLVQPASPVHVLCCTRRHCGAYLQRPRSCCYCWRIAAGAETAQPLSIKFLSHTLNHVSSMSERWDGRVREAEGAGGGQHHCAAGGLLPRPTGRGGLQVRRTYQKM